MRNISPPPPPDAGQRRPGGRVRAAALGGLLGAAIWLAFYARALVAGPALGFDDAVAMLIGATLAISLGAGLMALLFWSHRKGYDR